MSLACGFLCLSMQMEVGHTQALTQYQLIQSSVGNALLGCGSFAFFAGGAVID